MDSFRKTIEDEVPDNIKEICLNLKNKFGPGLRITRMFELLRFVFNIKEFLLIDDQLVQNGNFDSWLLDRQIDWQAGKSVDFSEVYKAILTAGDFLAREKIQFEEGNIEEKLWAIFLAVSNKVNS